MKYLDIGMPENFIREVKELGIKTVRLQTVRQQTSTKPHQIPFSIFQLIATATKKDLDYIVRFRETVGSDISYDKSKMLELHNKSVQREKGFTNALKDSGLKVKEGVWGEK